MLEEQQLHTATDLSELPSCFMCIHKVHWLLPACFPTTVLLLNLKWLEKIVLPARTRTSGCITVTEAGCAAGMGCRQNPWHLLGFLHTLQRARHHVHGQPVVLEALGLLWACSERASACLAGEVSVSGHLAAPNRLPDIGKSETNTKKPSKSVCKQCSGGKPACTITVEPALL